MKQHHRVNVGEKSIRREQHVARNREQSQWKHRFHAEGQEDKRGSGKTENINEVQNIPPRASKITTPSAKSRRISKSVNARSMDTTMPKLDSLSASIKAFRRL